MSALGSERRKPLARGLWLPRRLLGQVGFVVAVFLGVWLVVGLAAGNVATGLTSAQIAFVLAVIAVIVWGPD